MKSLVVLSCVLLYISSVKATDPVPEQRWGNPPPEWDDSPTLKEILGVGTQVGENMQVGTSGGSMDEPTSRDLCGILGGRLSKTKYTNLQRDRMVGICVDMFENGYIPFENPTTKIITATTIGLGLTEEPTAKADTVGPALTEEPPTIKADTNGTAQPVEQTTEAKDDADEKTAAPTTTTAAPSTTTAKAATTTTAAPATTTAAPATLFSCNFEQGWCGIEQDTETDNFNWTLGDSSVPSSSVFKGPTSAYSGSRFIFIEGLEQPEIDPFLLETANILLPALPSDQGNNAKACLTFKYQIYGGQTSNLKAYLDRTPRGDNSFNLISIRRDFQNNEWHEIQRDFFFDKDQRIRFIGTRGPRYSGNIALDDIIVTSGFCADKNEPEEIPGISDYNNPLY